MRVTFATEEQAYTIDVDAVMELGDIMALLEAESDIPIADQAIYHGQRGQLSDPKRTLQGYEICEDDILLLRNLRQPSTSSDPPGGANATSSQSNAAGGGPSDGAGAAEMARVQILANAELMRQLREAEPEIADAALNDPAKFRTLYEARGERYRKMQEEKMKMEELLMADPFDVEAQKKIEEAIRQERVLENMEHAMEFSPESFGRVTMLYVDVEVNGHPVKAFVDSGAQATIISPDCAQACNIMRLLDTRFAGIARGVGTAKILGRIHSAQIKVGSDLFLPCAFTVMEGKGVDLLFGLDMLKRYQACIDLERNVLRIQGREVRFLSEYELPRNALEEELEVDEHGNIKLPSNAPSHGAALGAAASASAQAVASGSGPAQKFQGSGNTLSASSSSSTPAAQTPQSQANRTSQANDSWPEASVQALMNMGVGRDEAVRLLDAAGGNVEMAANLMF